MGKYTVIATKEDGSEVKQTFSNEMNAEYYKAGIYLGSMFAGNHNITVTIIKEEENATE